MDPFRSVLNVRAHHLLCLLGFRGNGYSQEFVLNMGRVASATFLMGAQLQIVDSCDTICSACPHRRDNECGKKKDSPQIVKRHDTEVASKLGVKIGTELVWREVRTLIRQNITPEDLGKVCRNCEWLKFGYCVDALKQLQ